MMEKTHLVIRTSADHLIDCRDIDFKNLDKKPVNAAICVDDELTELFAFDQDVVGCDQPDRPQNTNVTINTTDEKITVTYNCHHGYQLAAKFNNTKAHLVCHKGV